MIAQLKYILVIALMLPVLVNAQKAPGYLGKKFSVGYDAYLFPSFANPTSPDAEPISDNDYRQKGVSLNFQHNFSGQWSFSKRSSLIASVGFVNTNYVPIRYDNSSFYGFTFDEYPSMSATSFAAGVRIFTQHYAPLSKFVEFRLGFATVKNDDFEYSAIAENSQGVRMLRTYTVEGGSKTLPTIAMAFGSSRVINELILITYGVDFNLFPGGLGNHVVAIGEGYNGSEFGLSNEGNTYDNQQALLKLAAARYGVQAAVNLRIGIGILL